MIQSEKLRKFLSAAETTTITLPDGKVVAISSLPVKIQQAVATLDEWVIAQKTMELELSKTSRAIASLRGDIFSSVMQHITDTKKEDAPPAHE